MKTQWYRSSARQTRRLMSTTYGPVNALYSETVAGVAVIRAFGAQSIFTRGMCRDAVLCGEMGKRG